MLCDRERGSVVSRAEDRDELMEMRANSFAAGFLMPVDGVTEFVRELGKGQASRETAVVYDDSRSSAVRIEGRTAPGSQALQSYDADLAATYFGVSRIAMIYRFKTLGMIKQPELDSLKAVEEARWKAEMGQSTNTPEPGKQELTAFQHRFQTAALEAYRREIISRGRLVELGWLIDLNEDQQVGLLDAVERIDGEAEEGQFRK